jgi:hypothetical protein
VVVVVVEDQHNEQAKQIWNRKFQSGLLFQVGCILPFAPDTNSIFCYYLDMISGLTPWSRVLLEKLTALT